MSKYSDKSKATRDLITDPSDFLAEIGQSSDNIKLKHRVDPLVYMEERHSITFPPLLEWLFRKIYNMVRDGEHAKLIAKAPRGGGKSWWAHVIEFCIWFFLDGDAVNMGGGEDQAKIVYQYIDTLISSDPDVEEWCTKRKMGETRQRALDGRLPHPVIHCVPASMKQVRGKHPGGPRKCAGMLVLDEAAEIEDRIFDSSLPMVNSAHPPVMIVISTFHKIFGKFQHVWDNAETLGFLKVSWDIFDTAERCFRNCDIDYHDDHEKGCLSEFVHKYCEVICDCYFDFDAHMGQYPRYKHNQCGRRCKKCNGIMDHKPRKIKYGWNGIQTIIEYRLVFDIETFEVEIMGWRPSSAGLVLNSTDIDNCVVAQTQPMEGYPFRLGIDWGVRGQLGIVLIQILPNIRVVIDAWAFTNPSDTKIYEFLKQLRTDWGVNQIYADSSHPFQNDHLKNECGFEVIEVVFSSEKELGVGGLRKLFEDTIIMIPANTGNNTALLINQLKNWRRNTETGKIIKRNDHLPDALLCTAIDVGGGIPIIGAHGKNVIEQQYESREEASNASIGEAISTYAEDY